MGSKRSSPRGQRFTHSPQVRQWLSTTGSLRHARRRTSMSMGQLNEHTPHCTQRLGSGKTHAVASVAYFSLSDLNQLKVLTMPSVGAARGAVGAVDPASYVLRAVSHQWERVVWVLRQRGQGAVAPDAGSERARPPSGHRQPAQACDSYGRNVRDGVTRTGVIMSRLRGRAFRSACESWRPGTVAR